MTLEELLKLLELADGPEVEAALTHPSRRNEKAGTVDNQRLEFLGDAVLGLCVAELLFERFPNADEGTLTRYRAALVNASALAEWGRSVGLSEVLRLGRGARSSGLAENVNVIADAVEALIAAAFLTRGLDGARHACSRIVEQSVQRLGVTDERDGKSELNERVQQHGLPAVSYVVTETSGPDHARSFLVEARIGDRTLAQGRGSSRRVAEQAAAQDALATGTWRPQSDRPAAPEETA